MTPTPNSGSGVTAFISYAREDRDFVEGLRHALEPLGIGLKGDWLLESGDTFPDRLRTFILACDAFLFILSPDSVSSQPCLDEVNLAAAHGKRIVPILFRDPGDKLLPPALRDAHWEFMRGDLEFATGVEPLSRAIRTDSESARAHSEQSLAADQWERRGRARAYLLQGEALDAAEVWLASASANPRRLPAPTPLISEFIAQSRQVAVEEQEFQSWYTDLTVLSAQWQGTNRSAAVLLAEGGPVFTGLKRWVPARAARFRPPEIEYISASLAGALRARLEQFRKRHEKIQEAIRQFEDRLEARRRFKRNLKVAAALLLCAAAAWGGIAVYQGRNAYQISEISSEAEVCYLRGCDPAGWVPGWILVLARLGRSTEAIEAAKKLAGKQRIDTLLDLAQATGSQAPIELAFHYAREDDSLYALVRCSAAFESAGQHDLSRQAHEMAAAVWESANLFAALESADWVNVTERSRKRVWEQAWESVLPRLPDLSPPARSDAAPAPAPATVVPPVTGPGGLIGAVLMQSLSSPRQDAASRAREREESEIRVAQELAGIAPLIPVSADFHPILGWIAKLSKPKTKAAAFIALLDGLASRGRAAEALQLIHNWQGSLDLETSDVNLQHLQNVVKILALSGNPRDARSLTDRFAPQSEQRDAARAGLIQGLSLHDPDGALSLLDEAPVKPGASARTELAASDLARTLAGRKNFDGALHAAEKSGAAADTARGNVAGEMIRDGKTAAALRLLAQLPPRDRVAALASAAKERAHAQDLALSKTLAEQAKDSLSSISPQPPSDDARQAAGQALAYARNCRAARVLAQAASVPARWAIYDVIVSECRE